MHQFQQLQIMMYGADKPVTAKEVLETLSKNVEITKKILTELIDKIPKTRTCSCAKALEEAEF